MKINIKRQSELIDSINNIRFFIESLETTEDCASCLHWKNDKCALVDKTPPIDVIKNGCEVWEVFDSIPF